MNGDAFRTECLFWVFEALPMTGSIGSSAPIPRAGILFVMERRKFVAPEDAIELAPRVSSRGGRK